MGLAWPPVRHQWTLVGLRGTVLEPYPSSAYGLTGHTHALREAESKLLGLSGEGR